MGRRDLPREAVDERGESTPATEVLESEGLSMGKEVKIGLGVIVALLVIFGGVLYYRLSGPPAEVAAVDKQLPKEPAGEVTVASDPPRSGSSPKVVTATAGAKSDQSKLSVSDMAQWSSKPELGRQGDTRPKDRPSPPQPSYMPRNEGRSGLPPGLPPDPFQRQTVQVQVDNGNSPSAGAAVAPSPAAMAYAGANAAAASLSPAPPPPSPIHSGPQEPAGEVEVGAASINPLRGLAADTPPGMNGIPPAPTSRGGYGYASSGSPSPINADPWGRPSPPPSPPATDHGAPPRSGYRSAPESPAYGSRFNVSSTRAEPSNSGTYVIQPNDNYWTISEQVYGSGSYFRALAERNRAKFPDPDRLKAGEEIATPGLAELEKSYPSLCPKAEHRDATKRHMSLASTPTRHRGGRVYVVQEGDTLFDIARYELGKAARWAEIYELNREAIGTDFDHLSPGMQLTLPQDHTPGKVTQRPGDLLQR